MKEVRRTVDKKSKEAEEGSKGAEEEGEGEEVGEAAQEK